MQTVNTPSEWLKCLASRRELEGQWTAQKGPQNQKQQPQRHPQQPRPRDKCRQVERHINQEVETIQDRPFAKKLGRENAQDQNECTYVYHCISYIISTNCQAGPHGIRDCLAEVSCFPACYCCTLGFKMLMEQFFRSQRGAATWPPMLKSIETPHQLRSQWQLQQNAVQSL